MATEGKAELQRLGDAIRARRRQMRGKDNKIVSQEGFAELCHLHRTYIGQLERGEKNVSFTNVLRVAKAFGILPSALLYEADL